MRVDEDRPNADAKITRVKGVKAARLQERDRKLMQDTHSVAY